MNWARVLRQARRRAGLNQSELARRTGMAQPAVARIEAGGRVPRVDTLEALLRACGQSLVVALRMGTEVDREPIRALLKRSPLDRMAGSGLRAARILQVLAARRVRFVVVGAAAERLQGSPVVPDSVELTVAADATNRVRLERALERFRTWRFNPVGRIRWRFRPLPGSPPYQELERVADQIAVAGHRVKIASVDDLLSMRLALSGPVNRDRAELLWAVREEQDRI
jgi:transcriptional regulator with XRE-family HTH domain